MATLGHSLACPDCVFRFTATTNNNGKAIWPHKTIPRWPILIMSYLVITTGLTTRRFSEKYILSFYFWMCIYSLFFWCYHKLWCTHISIFSSVLLQVYLLALILFGSLAFEIFKLCVKWWWPSTMNDFSQDNSTCLRLLLIATFSCDDVPFGST